MLMLWPWPLKHNVVSSSATVQPRTSQYLRKCRETEALGFMLALFMQTEHNPDSASCFLLIKMKTFAIANANQPCVIHGSLFPLFWRKFASAVQHGEFSLLKKVIPKH